MAKALETWEKQPADEEDFDVSYVAWLAARNDTAESVAVTVPDGITLVASTIVAGVVKVWLSGGTDKTTYRITVTLTSTGGRVKQAEFDVKVKEV